MLFRSFLTRVCVFPDRLLFLPFFLTQFFFFFGSFKNERASLSLYIYIQPFLRPLYKSLYLLSFLCPLFFFFFAFLSFLFLCLCLRVKSPLFLSSSLHTQRKRTCFCCCCCYFIMTTAPKDNPCSEDLAFSFFSVFFFFLLPPPLIFIPIIIVARISLIIPCLCTCV